MASPVISVRDLSVNYEEHQVLDRVNLDIQPNEIMVLLGGSGSGKTTLLRHIIGLERPCSGSVLVRDVDINNCSPQILKAIRRKVGVAFQEAALFNSLSTEENVALPLRELTDLAEPVIEIMVYITLAAVGLVEAGKLMPHELSGGMKKRAAVARAMVLDPDILVFDEPSAGLDPIVSAELDELILFLKQAFQMTILVVTHEIPSALRIADRVAMLYKGSLIAVENKDSFRTSADPRIRQFLDRIPEKIGEVPAVQEHLRELSGMTGAAS
jgi:phospholipid/cholesterol/gamma-HCH transport system ATP-binding protein